MSYFWNKRPLALIHVDTFRREYTSSWLLGEELRKRGYRVALTSRLSTRLILKFLVPDAVVLSHPFTLDVDDRIKAIKKGVRFYVNIVEEVIEDQTCMEVLYRDELKVETFSGLIVWSKWSSNWVKENTNILHERVHNFGSIRNSLLNRLVLKSDNNTIGVLSRFESLNNWDSRHQFMDILNLDPEDYDAADTRFYFEKKSIDAESFAIMCKLIRKLILADKNVKIRPHPNEAIDGYKILVKEFGPKVTIDRSLDVCEFLSSVDVVTGPVSSAYTEAYISGVPIVSFHNIQKFRYSNKEVYESLDELSECAYLPNNVEEVAGLCMAKDLEAKKSDKVDLYLDSFYSLSANPDPVSQVADLIVSEESKLSSISRLFQRLDFICLVFIDFLRLCQLLLKNRFSFSAMRNYHYNRLLHRPTAYLKALRRL
ncbi:hypothetical protein N8500_04540 [Candidatus Puniceispirillum sp.]|nr:hypothetical protein [Candidatus Puniceispirillum sp.]